jgi:acylphosphatase
MSRESVRVLVSGRVQGVFFRASTQEKAGELGLDGWVRNLPDGRVETQLEGEAGAVDEMLAWLRQGPAAAVVEDLRTRSVAPENRDGFDVI